jgi:hypothetical protein
VVVQRSLLVYDGRNSLFRAAAEAATRRSEDVLAVCWSAEPVQAFLEAQFDDHPFAFIVVDDDTVHVGTATVEWLLERGDVPKSVVDGLRRAYAAGGAPFGRLLHGRAVADLDGSFALAADAAAHLEDLRRVHEITVQEAVHDGR